MKHKSYKYKSDSLKELLEEYQQTKVKILDITDALATAQDKEEELVRKVVYLFQETGVKEITVNRVCYSVEGSKLIQKVLL